MVWHSCCKKINKLTDLNNMTINLHLEANIKAIFPHIERFVATLYANAPTHAPIQKRTSFHSSFHSSVSFSSLCTHHSCLLVGRQSLFEAVTPMAICITVIYFWYFISPPFCTTTHTAAAAAANSPFTSRNPCATKAAQVSVHSNVYYSPLPSAASEAPFPRRQVCWLDGGKCSPRSSTKGATPPRPTSALTL